MSDIVAAFEAFKTLLEQTPAIIQSPMGQKVLEWTNNSLEAVKQLGENQEVRRSRLQQLQRILDENAMANEPGVESQQEAIQTMNQDVVYLLEASGLTPSAKHRRGSRSQAPILPDETVSADRFAAYSSSKEPTQDLYYRSPTVWSSETYGTSFGGKYASGTQEPDQDTYAGMTPSQQLKQMQKEAQEYEAQVRANQTPHSHQEQSLEEEINAFKLHPDEQARMGPLSFISLLDDVPVFGAIALIGLVKRLISRFQKSPTQLSLPDAIEETALPQPLAKLLMIKPKALPSGWRKLYKQPSQCRRVLRH